MPHRRAVLTVLLTASAYTLLNAAKPLQVDDTAYYYFAAQLARRPLDPYGFEILWYEELQPANEVLAPPVLPYWWSLAIRLFGERPVLWKLWLWPFALLLAGALYALGRRFAPGMEARLVVLTLFSPAFLPAFNLMLDVPALALSLGGLALFFHAQERRSLGWAVAAGLVSGLACQTKYTSFLGPVTMILYALVVGRLRFALLAAAVAALVFGSWEFLVARWYGESHFLLHLRDSEGNLLHKFFLAAPLLSTFGALGAPAGLLCAVGLHVRRWSLMAFAGVALLPYVVLATVSEHYVAFNGRLGPLPMRFTASDALFRASGILVCAVIGAALVRRCRIRRWVTGAWRRRPLDTFLLLWLALEVAGYFALSPFPAARRLMGLTLVATLIAGRLASRTCRGAASQRLLNAVVAAGVLLGLAYFALDFREAQAQRAAAEQAALVAKQGGARTTWFVGHWGFQFYAEQAGMQPAVAERSQIRLGDWLVVPDPNIDQQHLDLAHAPLEPVATVRIEDAVPIHSVPPYYGGLSPLQRHDGPRVTVTLYRATADFVPQPRPADPP
jgi:4-amino-4-deoxy-L-arabinose transferase-like glycosyltransferase